MIQRKDRGIAFALLIMLIASPIAVSYVYSAMNGIVHENAVSFDIESLVQETNAKVRTSNSNSTSTGYATQTAVYDNTTDTVTVADLTFNWIDSPEYCVFTIDMNFTKFSDVDISRVTLEYQYIGSGNITDVRFDQRYPSYKIFQDWGGNIQYPSNSTLSWVPEAFESVQLKSSEQCVAVVTFADEDNLPSDGDYISVSIHVYTSDTIISQKQLLELLAGGSAFLLFVVGAAISPFWNPTTHRYYRRSKSKYRTSRRSKRRYKRYRRH